VRGRPTVAARRAVIATASASAGADARATRATKPEVWAETAPSRVALVKRRASANADARRLPVARSEDKAPTELGMRG